MASREEVKYTHGHHESVLRSHKWRTAENSAAYLLDKISPAMHILDVGCGPGTITADLAKIAWAGKGTGLDNSLDIVEEARNTAAQRGVKNVHFDVGDVTALKFPDNTFNLAHAHQLLQHVGDPIKALQELRRVVKPGGFVAVRDSDYSTMTWYPDVPGMKDWQALYLRVARSNGGEPDAGRRLHAWAQTAGFDRDKIKKSASTWLFSSPEERAWWSGLWADRSVASSFAQHTIEGGHATQDDLQAVAQTWRQWGAEPDGWFVVVHGEILCHV